MSRAPSNLPSPLTRLVGRSEEVAQQSAVLASPDVRLLTFVGAAGVGKTRLALAVADGSDDGYRHDSSVVLEALRLFYEFADFAGIAESLEILSAYAGRLGNGRGVARGSGVAEVLRKSVRTPHFPCQRETYRSMPSAARQAVDQVVWSAAWAEGAAPPDEAIAEQLGRA